MGESIDGIVGCVKVSNGKCPKYIIQPEIKITRENLSHSGDPGKSLTEFDENFIAEYSFDCKSAGTITVLNLQPATF